MSQDPKLKKNKFSIKMLTQVKIFENHLFLGISDSNFLAFLACIMSRLPVLQFRIAEL
jgi:hypothetical protein